MREWSQNESLFERAEREQLSADQIKRAISTWVPDWDRT